MFQLTKKGREVADALDGDPKRETFLSSIIDWDLPLIQQICLNWLRGKLGPELMDRAIKAKAVNPIVPKVLKKLVKKDLVEEV